MHTANALLTTTQGHNAGRKTAIAVLQKLVDHFPQELAQIISLDADEYDAMLDELGESRQVADDMAENPRCDHCPKTIEASKRMLVFEDLLTQIKEAL